MTNAKDYISDRTKLAEKCFPLFQKKLENLIDKPESKKEFITNGEISISEEFSSEIARFRAQSEELFNQLCNWLKESGWCLAYKPGKNPDDKCYFGRPYYLTYYLVPEEYVHK